MSDPRLAHDGNAFGVTAKSTAHSIIAWSVAIALVLIAYLPSERVVSVAIHARFTRGVPNQAVCESQNLAVLTTPDLSVGA